MSMIAMAQPVPHSVFKRDFAWDEARQPEFTMSRPWGDAERVALPSIRQAFPELSLRILRPEANARTPPSTTSPVMGLGAGAVTPPEYVHSPNQQKRRRLSFGEEVDERASQVPRLYTSPTSIRDPQMTGSRGMSPALSSRCVTDSWAGASRTSPYLTHTGALPPMREQPAPIEVSERERLEHRSSLVLPRLLNLDFDRGSATMPRIRGRSSDDGRPDSAGQAMAHAGGMVMEPRGPPFRPGSFFGYHHPSRAQSLSLGSIHGYDRGQFSSAGYGPQYHQDCMRIGELGGPGLNGDNKQRKRRGNLPKETTDKLRAWFISHLQHPYPTEDEKQELMRQTGLQMNQISNWFINARRRQLPALKNNARAESDAMASALRGADGKVLSSTERDEYDVDGKRRGSLSDGDGSSYDDDYESLRRRPTADIGRGSV
ncbi:hypothetical protein QBC46DRAFT_364062 [Diplogelasinospora grovesii]|uniref:Homeobox domain-containing protein n=1 Tax=Diplogelasinospora grovesii TaxID=303347 RepID=A0AAN6N811_9PEZI|nr:hypothetical protein QBC46DRAFT_364062 [Diplogelasinospora grovesii]